MKPHQWQISHHEDLWCYSNRLLGRPHESEKSLARTRVPWRNSWPRTFISGTYGIGGCSRKTIFSHSRSFRPSGADFTRLIVCRFYLIFLWLYIFFYKSVNLSQGVVTLRPKTFLSNTKKHWGGGQLKILVSFLSGNVPEFHCFKKISIFSMEFFFQE